MKKIVLDENYISIFSKLTNEELGELIKALMYYHCYDIEIDFKNTNSRIIFSFLKNEVLYEESEKKKIKKVNKEDFIEKIINLFKERYRNFYNIDYVVANRGKERTAVGKLISLFKKYYPNFNSDEMYDFFGIFFDSVFTINDKFIQDNMSISLIYNNINKILKTLKYGSTTKITKSKAIEAGLKELEDIVKQNNDKYLQ